MKPSIYDPFFVIPEGENDDDEPNGTRFGNLFDYRSGIRATGAFRLPCTPFNGYMEGLYLRDTARRSLNNFPNQALGTKGETSLDIDDLVSADSKLHYLLWSIKGGLRYSLCHCSPFEVSFRLGVQYAQLQLDENIFYLGANGDNNFYDALMRGWGVGPEIGIDAGYCISSSLMLVARGSYALLVGDINSTMIAIELNSGGALQDDVLAKNDPRTVVAPVTELKVGLNYQLFCLPCRPSIEVGYDVICYANMLDHIRWCGDASTEGLTFDHFTPFMLHGLYVSLSAGF